MSLLRRLRDDYVDVFRSPSDAKLRLPAKRVLADLSMLCHAAKTTFGADPHHSAYLQGRRDVWLHIQNMLNLDEDLIRFNERQALEEARDE
jgi:hypothetical protein